MHALLVCLAVLGVAGAVSGVIIALLAWRKAPDGYEDQAGFHKGQRRESVMHSLTTYGLFGDGRGSDNNNLPPAPPQAG